MEHLREPTIATDRVLLLDVLRGFAILGMFTVNMTADLPWGGIATIGNYDGIHRGQLEVIERVVARAREAEVQSVLITFDPHPVSVLRPEVAPALLTTAEQRDKLLAGTGLDVLLILRFNAELAKTSAEDFVRRILHQALRIQAVYVGKSFRFGRRREG